MDAAAAQETYVPVAIADRSGHDESVHFGAVVVLDADGTVLSSMGDPLVPIYPRSSNKPIQAEAMLRLGLRLDSQELALACASHDGTVAHLAVVERILAGAGLTADALANTPDFPLDDRTAEGLLAAGGRRTPIQMNCSGKHAAMLATCVVNGWDIHAYLDPMHPLQRALTDRIAELAGGVVHVGVDGCGAPAHVVSLIGLATGFRSMAVAQGPVWEAITSHPELVGGERRDVTRLIKLVPGLLAKDGAEGVFAAALPDGRAAAVKISDGNSRAAGIVLAAALAVAGVDIDPHQLGEPILGHGHPVGSVRPIDPRLST